VSEKSVTGAVVHTGKLLMVPLSASIAAGDRPALPTEAKIDVGTISFLTPYADSFEWFRRNRCKDVESSLFPNPVACLILTLAGNLTLDGKNLATDLS
jgi:hypothetical protein